MKKIVSKILSVFFPYKELDSRPLYLFSTETWLQNLSRTQNLDRYIDNK